MSTAFEPRDCYQSTVEAITRLLVNCNVEQVPSIPLDPDARAVLMTSMPTSFVSRMRSSRFTGCQPDLDSNGDPIPDSESEPFIRELVLDAESGVLQAVRYVDTFDTCGNFIESVFYDTEDVAELGDCPTEE